MTESIKIDEDGKYIMIIEDRDGILTDRDLNAMAIVIREWWESDQKFVILAEWGNIDIKLEKLETV